MLSSNTEYDFKKNHGAAVTLKIMYSANTKIAKLKVTSNTTVIKLVKVVQMIVYK